MNLGRLLFCATAGFVAASGVRAADALVAKGPEPMDYVRVCDAFGTGYFYLPGTETCLKVGGYVRTVVSFNDNKAVANWNARTRGLLSFDTRTDTELGTLGGFVSVRAWADGDYAGGSLEIEEAYLRLGGFKAGYGYNYWDAGLAGETDDLGSNRINMIGYEYKGDALAVGVFLDELTGFYSNGDPFGLADATPPYGGNSNIGIEAQISGSLGDVTVSLLSGYDIHAEEGSIRGIASVRLGPGTLTAAALWTSGPNAYYDVSEWAAAAEYAMKFGKWKVIPAAQYWWNLGFQTAPPNQLKWWGADAWRAGITIEYEIVSGLFAKTSLQYQKVTHDGFGLGYDHSAFTGYVRLQRTF